MNNLFSVADITFGEGLIYFLFGILMVFLVLCSIIGILHLLKIICADRKSKNVVIKAVNEQSQDEDDNELVAVITVAVSMCLEKEGVVSAPFKIKKIKRINK